MFLNIDRGTFHRKSLTKPLFLLTFLFALLVPYTGFCKILDSSAFFFKQPYLESPATVYTITQEDLKNFGIRKISDILKYFGNVNIYPNDRHLDRIYVRGIGSKYNKRILLLINGIPFKEPVYEHAYINEFIPIENIELVEFIYGPASALFGTNSIAATINIITRTPNERNVLNVQGILGSDATKGISVLKSLPSKSLNTVVFMKYYSSEGEGPGQAAYGNYPTLFLNNDPSEVSQFNITSFYKTLRFNIDYTYHKNKYTIGYDFPPWQTTYFRYRKLSTNLRWHYNIKPQLFLESLIYEHYFDDDNLWYNFSYDTGYLNYTIQEATKPVKQSNLLGHSGRLYYIKTAKDIRHQFIAGYTVENINVIKAYDDVYDSAGNHTQPYKIPPTSETNFSLYTEYGLNSRKLKFISNLRADYYNEFGFTFNPRFLFSCKLMQPLQLRISASEGFRAPNAREFHTVTSTFTQGNPNLKPEKVFSPEFALSYIRPKLRVIFSAFYNKFWDFVGVEKTDTHRIYENMERGENTGAELNVQIFWQRQKFNLFASYLTIPKQTLYNLPRFKAAMLHSIYIDERITLNFAYTYRSAISLAQHNDLPGVFLVNTFLLYNTSSAFCKLSIENLFNTNYSVPGNSDTDRPYGMPGRKIYFTLGIYL